MCQLHPLQGLPSHEVSVLQHELMLEQAKAQPDQLAVQQLIALIWNARRDLTRNNIINSAPRFSDIREMQAVLRPQSMHLCPLLKAQ
jgi:hypothetical protein